MSQLMRPDDVGYAVNRLAKELRRAMSQALCPTGLTPQQAAVLLAIHGADRLSAGEVAERIGTDKATMSGLVARLSRDGWLHVDRDSGDKRALALRLTGRSAEMIPEIIRASQSVDRLATALLGEDRRSQVVADIEAMADALSGTQR